jgi:hypothetical protein
MAILARLSLFLPVVGASQPLSEGIVNNRVVENSKMAWGAELAALLKLRIGVLARRDVVQGPGKELMSLERPPEFVGKHSCSFGKRKSCGRIEDDIPDFVAEIAVNAFRSYSLDKGRIGYEGIIDRSHGSMTGGAVAGMVRIVEFVPRSVVGQFRIRAKRNKPEVT